MDTQQTRHWHCLFVNGPPINTNMTLCCKKAAMFAKMWIKPFLGTVTVSMRSSGVPEITERSLPCSFNQPKMSTTAHTSAMLCLSYTRHA